MAGIFEEPDFSFDKIENVEIEDINTKDYPDFVDAYVSYAEYNGKKLTEEELDELNDVHGDWIYDQVIEQIF